MPLLIACANGRFSITHLIKEGIFYSMKKQREELREVKLKVSM